MNCIFCRTTLALHYTYNHLIICLLSIIYCTLKGFSPLRLGKIISPFREKTENPPIKSRIFAVSENKKHEY